jgi:2-polyprenyl-3-methyl-5-hydroxy-6-metoxy-1,4-benzoquinol methylase
MPKPKRTSLLRDITPPVLVRLLRPSRSNGPRRATNGMRPRQNGSHAPAADGHEQDATYYDDTFHRSEHWLRDYTESHYDPVWAVVADRITRAGVTSVVDLGCGPGQVAALLHEKGVPRYLGVDFSDARIQRAREVCPEYEFLAADIFESDVLSARDYDAVVATEFLEHIDRDLDVLDAIKPGTHVFGTVPNFGGEGHVRHFETPDAVRARYGSRLADMDVHVHRADTRGRTFFLLDGVKT